MNSEPSKRILADGVFDLLHVGHLDFFAQAKSLGDVLIAAVMTDTCLLHHGYKVATIPDKDRFELLSSISIVDEVIWAPEQKPYPISFLKEHAISLAAHGDDSMLLDWYGEWHEAGKMVYLPYSQRESTTLIRKRIRERSQQE